MAGRIRSIKPEILDDEVVAALPHLEFRLFVSMFVMADDYGNLSGIPARVKGSSLWGTPETVGQVRDALEHLAQVGLIEIYRVRGQAFIHLSGWSKHQKVDHPGKPIYPGPDQADSSGYDDSRGPRENLASTDEELAPDQDQRPTTGTTKGPGGDPGQKAQGSAPKSKTKPHIMPADFGPSDTHRAYATEHGLDLDAETAKFCDHHRAKGSTFASWPHALSTWLRNSVDWRQRDGARPTSGGGGRKPTGMSAMKNLFDRAKESM